MTEIQPTKPNAKNLTRPKNPFRPTTEGHTMKDFDPGLERNQPLYTKEKIKYNLDAEPFKSEKKIEKVKETKNDNSSEYYNNTQCYNQNNYINMNQIPQYRYPMPMIYTNQVIMPILSYPPNYSYFQPNFIYQANQNYSENYLEPNADYQNFNSQQNEVNSKPKEETKNKTGLNLNSKSFVPRSRQAKEEKKQEGLPDLNINANPYEPQKKFKEKETTAQEEEKRRKEEERRQKEEERIKREEEERQKKEEEEKRRKEEEERIKKEKEEKKRKEEEERIKKEEEEKIKREEEERQKKEEERTMDKSYLITLINKQSGRKEKYSFEYIIQFQKWNICTQDDLLTKEVKDHISGFKQELREMIKMKGFDKNNKSKNSSIGIWRNQTDYQKEEEQAKIFIEQLEKQKKQNILKQELTNILNQINLDNCKEKKKEILDKIKDNDKAQDVFLDIIYRKAVFEKGYVKLYSKLLKDLDKDLSHKNKQNEKEGENKKRQCSEMRTRLINKCRTIFKLENDEQYDEYIKEKDQEERRLKLKKFILGNIDFITELMHIKILSKKVGPECLKNLLERYRSEKIDETLRNITLEAITRFAENFGRIVYEEKSIKAADKEAYNKVLDGIFIQLEKIKDEPGIAGKLKFGIINLLEKRKNNFAMSKFDQSLIAKTKEQVEKELESEGKITQDNINRKMIEELKDYKESLEEEEDFEWKNTSFLMQKCDYYGKILGNILEGYFTATTEILDKEKKYSYVKTFITELIQYYEEDLSERDITELKERLINLFEFILDDSIDVPEILDIYAYVLNLFLEIKIIKFIDLSELKKENFDDEKISSTLKSLHKYYKGDNCKEKLSGISWIKNCREKYEWVFE